MEPVGRVRGRLGAVAPGITQLVCPEGGHMRAMGLLPVVVVDRAGRCGLAERCCLHTGLGGGQWGRCIGSSLMGQQGGGEEFGAC